MGHKVNFFIESSSFNMVSIFDLEKESHFLRMKCATMQFRLWRKTIPVESRKVLSFPILFGRSRRQVFRPSDPKPFTTICGLWKKQMRSLQFRLFGVLRSGTSVSNYLKG